MNLFGKRLVSGKAVGAQEDLARKLNRVFDILENIEGVGGIRLTKDGIDWRICPDASGINSGGGGGGIPDGYTETTVPVEWRYDTESNKWQYKTATVLVKDDSTSETWTDGITFEEFDA